MSLSMNDSNLKNALAELREVLSRSQADNSEVGELLKQMESVVGDIESKTLHKAFMKACVRAEIENFRWHDLRHTAITRLAKKLPNLIELAAVSGHRSLTMLKRYYHPSATDLARKIG